MVFISRWIDSNWLVKHEKILSNTKSRANGFFASPPSPCLQNIRSINHSFVDRTMKIFHPSLPIFATRRNKTIKTMPMNHVSQRYVGVQSLRWFHVNFRGLFLVLASHSHDKLDGTVFRDIRVLSSPPFLIKEHVLRVGSTNLL